MNCIDLHIHTTASDGTDPPRAAVEKAASLGLAAVSITDHDSVSGVPEAMRAGAELGVEVVPGIEVSSDYRDNNVHILGYFIDPAAPELRPVLDWVKTERDERNEKIGYKIREAQVHKVPYMIVIGDKDEEKGIISVRNRKTGETTPMELSEFIEKLDYEVKNRLK